MVFEFWQPKIQEAPAFVAELQSLVCQIRNHQRASMSLELTIVGFPFSRLREFVATGRFCLEFEKLASLVFVVRVLPCFW